jgi:hypothetical protein
VRRPGRISPASASGRPDRRVRSPRGCGVDMATFQQSMSGKDLREHSRLA